MGSVRQHRGYNDDTLFTAMNTQEKVACVNLKKCKKTNSKDCYTLKQKWSYAIPLEIIYMTPLYKWNPFNLKHYGNQNWRNLNTITENRKRNGDCKNATSKAYKGINSRHLYQTPASFYSGSSVSSASAADTAKGVTCVLDQQGVSHQVRASGTHIFLPQIKDVGMLRMRYPIFPVHGEGSSVWKELNALREITMNEPRYDFMYWKNADLQPTSKITTLQMGFSLSVKTGRHTHDVTLDDHEMLMLKGGQVLVKMTTTANGHSHTVTIRNLWWRKDYYEFVLCDGKKECWDKHAKQFIINSS